MNYPVQQSAQGLASLGRGNDTMLMHVTPREVEGLQGLAMAHGGSLTINPHTGLPEAGFFDTIFDFAAPIIGGYFGMDPFLMAGIMGGKSLVTEGDPLKAAFSAFGGYSGAKLGSGFESFGKAPTIPTAELNTFENAASNIEKMDPSNLMQADKAIGADKAFGFADTTPYNQLGTQGAGINLGQSPQVNQVFNQSPGGNIGYPNFSNPTIPTEVFGKAPGAPGIDSTSGATQGVQIPGATEPISPIQGFGQDVMTAGRSPIDFARHIGEGNALTGGAKIAMYGASPFMEDIMKPAEPVAFRDPDEGKWRSDTGGLSLSDKFDTGLRLKPLINVREGGAISGYAAGGNVSTGTVTTGGLSDLYGATDLQSNPSLSRDGYGIGRLDSLASEGSRAKAADTFYARGGYLDGQGDGMSDSIPATIEGKQPARLADGEFVVPADVVSHLGNGSSKAGSKRLYAMLDKVRKARTGHTKQGKQINPNKYMPA